MSEAFEPATNSNTSYRLLPLFDNKIYNFFPKAANLKIDTKSKPHTHTTVKQKHIDVQTEKVSYFWLCPSVVLYAHPRAVTPLSPSVARLSLAPAASRVLPGLERDSLL